MSRPLKEVVPFESIGDALDSLDNGGRFYNLFTKADDGNIDAPELGKIAGVFSDKQVMILYFAMSIANLDQAAREQIQAALSGDLQQAYHQFMPLNLLPSEASTKVAPATSIILTGVPTLVEANKSELKGFIMVGKGIMVPLIDQYDVYKMGDDATATAFSIAHARGTRLPAERINVGGVVKEITVKEAGKDMPRTFLEALYYCPAS